MNSCIFCQILSGNMPCVNILEDDQFIAILDVFPWSDGHTIIFPKDHHKDIENLPTELSSKLMAFAKKVQKKLLSSDLPCEGTHFLMNQGSMAGQTVFHVHLHIIPRNKHDKFSFQPMSSEMKSIDELKKVAEKINSPA